MKGVWGGGGGSIILKPSRAVTKQFFAVIHYQNKMGGYTNEA
jgi:hypothetical protein